MTYPASGNVNADMESLRAEIVRLRAKNRELNRRATVVEGPLWLRINRLECEVGSTRRSLEAANRSSADAWAHVRAHSDLLERTLMRCDQLAEANPGLGFEEILNRLAEGMKRLYPSGPETDDIIRWKRQYAAFLKERGETI